MTPLVPQNLDDKGESTETNKSIQRGFGVRRGEATFQPEDGGTICPEQSDRNSIPTGTDDGEDVPDHETVGGELGASRSMKKGQKKRLLGGIIKTKTQREKWYETVKEEEKLHEQQGRHSTVHRFL